jgi:DNA-binding NarL/FixJ family response regulator
MWRSGASEATPRSTETPYALQIAGNWRSAAAAWDEIGCPYEQATALYDSDSVDDLLSALGILDDLGAAPAARLVRSKLQRLGVRRIPRGARRATRANPAGLTLRQAEVLGLIAEGLTNAEIADELFVSAKTVDHHVSAILTKLEVGSRHEAARTARHLGLVDEVPRDEQME